MGHRQAIRLNAPCRSGIGPFRDSKQGELVADFLKPSAAGSKPASFTQG